VLNVANEVAVESFLAEEIKFTQIPRLIEACLSKHAGLSAASLDELLAADHAARIYARHTIDLWGR
jgi:1-deoxy-D-xylulose-5-phosphate reductoisomerase